MNEQPHPAYATDEAQTWFRNLLAEVGRLPGFVKAANYILGKPPHDWIKEGLPNRLGSYLLLSRAVHLFDRQRAYWCAELPMHAHVQRALADACLLRPEMERTELRYAAHLIATGTLLELEVARQQIYRSNNLTLPEGFREKDFADEPTPTYDYGPLPEAVHAHVPMVRRSKRTALSFYLAKRD